MASRTRWMEAMESVRIFRLKGDIQLHHSMAYMYKVQADVACGIVNSSCVFDVASWFSDCSILELMKLKVVALMKCKMPVTPNDHLLYIRNSDPVAGCCAPTKSLQSLDPYASCHHGDD
ncbi:Os01g0210650 [Oryza sativa Japonica Group]|uniref:Os01g0210650 protein n=1 Tax=Oryza sativa subsp. japonica TaxID=39947 RepID=A0A0P0V075_ORYSJ|nr:Os01g0210650 [Oryza sativa Japonica Group]